MTDRAENPLGTSPRRILTTFVASVLIVALLSMTVVSNGYALQNVGVFLGLLPASAAESGYNGTTIFDGLAQIFREAYAAKPVSNNQAANIDQCTNGGVGKTPEPCKIGSGYSNWVNGNSNGQKSHWKEGEFISYRTTVTGLSGDNSLNHTLRIQYDTVHGGKHAIDYLGSFDATETTANTASGGHANMNDPCGDKFTCVPGSPADTEAIDTASLVNCGGSAGSAPTQAAGEIKGFVPGGNTFDIIGFSYVSQNLPAGQGQCSTTAEITFKTSANTVVLAWGGHIASEAPSTTPGAISGWGAGNSASFISGSPYHMALQLLDGASTGSQDRALSTSAVVFTPTVTTTIRRESDDADVTNGSVANGTTVHDTAALVGASSNAGGTVEYKFYTNSNCTGTPDSTQTVSVTNALVQNSSSHTLTSGFGGTSGYCFTATYSGDSKNIGPVTSPIEPVTVNPPPAGTITIVKDTVPNDGTNFNFTTSGGLSLATFLLDDDSDPALSNSTTFVNVLTGNYTVTETTDPGYKTTLSCSDPDGGSSPSSSAETNSATIDVDNGETITCTFTNTKLATITIIKDTVPDDASVFGYETNVTGTTTSFSLDDDGTNSNPNNNTAIFNNVQLGVYNVTELANSAYGTSVSCTDTTENSDPSAEIATRTAILVVDAGDNIVCTFTNTKLLVKITAYGYENEPTGLAVGGFVNGTTTYTVKIKNFGGVNATLDVNMTASIFGGSASPGSFTYVSSSGPGTSSAPTAGDNCESSCDIGWTDVTLAPNAVATFTVTVWYNGVPDGTIVQMDLEASYDSDVAGSTITRSVSGSLANIMFTAQSD